MISTFLETSSLNERIPDLNEMIRMSIFKRDEILLKELMTLLIQLRSRTLQSMSDTKEAIIRENFLTLVAQYDETGKIFDVLDEFRYGK